MKPQPRRRPAPSIPKAQAPDPATMNASGTKATIATSVSGQGQSSATEQQVAGNGTVASNQPAAAQAKLTIRMDADDLGRARTAWRVACAQPSSDYPTFGQWAASALIAATEAVETDHNNGRPFRPTPAGVLPTGNAARR